MARSVGRSLLLVVLALAMAGFGICSLCGGAIGVSSLVEGRTSSRDGAWLAFGLSGLGALIAYGCWRGIRALREPR
jgi:hypothetical protein